MTWLVESEDIFFHLWGVLFLGVGTSDESRQRGEGDNDIRMGLVELDRELFGTTGLVLNRLQTLRTLHSLPRRRTLGTEDYDVKILCDSIIQSLLRQWSNWCQILEGAIISLLRSSPSATHRM